MGRGQGAYDDPYKMLANNIVVTCSDLEISNILHHAKSIRMMVKHEVYEADFYGRFLDCINTILVGQGRRREVNRTLQKTADFFYDQLDVARLRSDIRYYCNLYGKDIK